MQKLIHFLEMLRAWLDANPSFAVLAFAGVFLALQLFMIPVAPMGLAAGLFFGFSKGWLALMFGCVLGATANFFIARHFARAWVMRKFGGNENFRLIDAAIGREGWKMVMLLRFVPIPFGFANYCYGLTPVRYLGYILATCVAISPANSLFVWIGSTSGGELSALLGKGRARHPLEYVFIGLGIAAALLALGYAAKVAKNAVERGRTAPPLSPP